LEISYINKNKENTDYYIGVKDIIVDKGILICDIFNLYRSNCLFGDGTKTASIFINSIKSASVLEQSYYDTPEDLIERANSNGNLGDFLETINFDNNILNYLSDCYRLDNDPFLKEKMVIDGIDLEVLQKEKQYTLSNKEFNDILEKVFKNNRYESERINRHQVLAINEFSIDIYDKQYVVAYRELMVDFKNKTLKVAKKSSINQSFLISEEKSHHFNVFGYGSL